MEKIKEEPNLNGTYRDSLYNPSIDYLAVELPANTLRKRNR